MTPSATAPHPKLRGSDLLRIAALAVALRVALALLVLRGAHATFHAYANSSDGAHYIAMAQPMRRSRKYRAQPAATAPTASHDGSREAKSMGMPARCRPAISAG